MVIWVAIWGNTWPFLWYRSDFTQLLRRLPGGLPLDVVGTGIAWLPALGCRWKGLFAGGGRGEPLALVSETAVPIRGAPKSPRSLAELQFPCEE